MPQTLGFLVLSLLPNAAFAGLVGAIGFAGVGALALGIGAGILYAASLALRQKPPTQNPSDVQANIRQEISPRRRIYSRFLTGSVIVFGFRRGEKTYVIHYICEGPIGGFVSFRLDKKPITLDADGFVQESQYNVDGRSRVQIKYTLGLMTDGPFQAIIDAFPELNTPLTPFRHRGCAMVLQIVEQVPQDELQDTYPNNLPGLQVVIDGYEDCYDPRIETHGLSGNAGVCLLTEIMDVYGLTPEDDDDVNFESFAAFADHCDTAVALKAGGNEPRYRCAGMLNLNAENEDRIQALARVCNADVYMDAQGRIAVRQKMRANPGIALRAKNGDHLELQLEGGRSMQRKFNTVKVTYLEPALNYKANEVSWQHPELVAEDGQEFSEPFDALLCPSATQAQRLGKLAVHEANPEFSGSMVSGPQALDLMEDYTFTLDLSPEDDFERVACATSAIEYDSNSMAVSFPIVVYRAGSTDWNPAVDEQDALIIPPELPSRVEDVELDVTVSFEVQQNSAPVLKFSWEAAGSASLPDSYSQLVEVSPADADDWSPARVNQEQNTAVYGPVADGAAYDWRIRNVAAGKTFDWQESTTPVTVTIDPTPPKSLTSFFEGNSAPHLGNAPLVFVTKPDSHLYGVNIYRAPAGATLDKTAHYLTTVAAAPGSTVGYTDGDTTPTNLLANGDFSSDTVWTKGPGWTIGGGVATHATGSSSSVAQAVSITAGLVYRIGYRVPTMSAGTFRSRLTGGTNVNGTLRSAVGTYLDSLTALAGNTAIDILGSSTFAGTLDDVAAFVPTPDSTPQGRWDYYAIPINISGKEGAQSGPVTITVI